MLELPKIGNFENKNQEISLDDFLSTLKINKNRLLEQEDIITQELIIEQEELMIYEEYFEGNLELTTLNSKINKNKYEIKQSFENSEKRKLYEYSQLADLSYIDLKTIEVNGETEVSFNGIELDPLSFQNINTLFGNPDIDSLSEDEKYLYAYIVKNKNIVPDYTVVLNQKGEEIIKMSGLSRQILAQNDEKYQNILSDVYLGNFDEEILRKRAILISGINSLIEAKEKNAEQNLEKLKQEYEILDYYPNESKGEKSESGFGATLLKKDGKMYITIRGTE